MQRGSSRTVSASFPVTLSTAPIQTVTVDFATSDGTRNRGHRLRCARRNALDLSLPVNASSAADAQGQASLSFVSRSFYTLTPCRILDTRNAAFGEPALEGGSSRSFAVVGLCEVPSTAKAVSVNVTVTGSTSPGNVRLYPAGTALPLISTINYGVGQTRANNAVVALGSTGEIGVYCGQMTGTVELILDVTGYFE